MSIKFICRDCKGKGRVDQKLWVVSRKSKCRTCGGEGKRKYVKIEMPVPASK